MKVILKERVENLGKVGDIVEVKDGFARNYLLPKGIALVCTPSNLKYIEDHKKKLELVAVKEESDAKELAKAIEGLVVTIKKKAGSEGKLFGSVSVGDIVDELAKQKVEIDKKKVLLSEPIKLLGEYKVKLRLYPEIEPAIKVIVAAEEV
ncbi:50S ribosomal protein L9 [Candidatus Dependentiae bacterium]|nr:50S ribosomal protein L9 [Candidatus Dependentiae bacterium]